MSTATAVAAVLVVVGLLGVVIPVLPGPVLVWAGITFWAVDRDSGAGYGVLALSTLALLVGLVAKYVLPGRRLRESGVPWATMAFGGVVGIIGFFVIPVLGLPIGFVLGVYLAESARLGAGAAWPSTKEAVAAVGVSMLIELGSGLVATAVWIAGALLTN